MIRTFLCVLCIAAISAAAVWAHQPRLVGGRTSIEVKAPEVSKAYYGTLEGEAACYRIASREPFELYVGLLVPDLPGIEIDFTVQIFKINRVIAVLDGANHEWRKYHEPFGGDRYLQGPEYRSTVGVGIYEIYVYSSDNRGKYVLAIGEREEWPMSEISAALKVMPALKRDFFEKSLWSLLGGRIGLLLVSLVVALALLCAIAVVIARWARQGIRKRATPEG